jgi:FAD:protein FMN transferase
MLLIICFCFPCGCAALPPARHAPPSSRFEFTALRMGVKARVVVYAPDEEAARAGTAAVLARIAELESILSDYRPESELSRLTVEAYARDARVSPDLWAVLSRGQLYAEASGGAFDMTVGALSALWRQARATARLPTPQETREARERSGHRLLVLNQSSGSARLLAPGVRLDAGGIAKGYAVREALAELRRRGLSSALVALAGDIAVGDPPPGEAGWRIRVETGLAPPAEIILSDAIISTSGADDQFVEIGGVRYAHIIDPRTGLGSTRRAAAVVISRDGMEADALGTCLFLLGVEEGPALLRAFPGVRAWILEERAGAIREFRSEDFNRLLLSAPATPAAASEGSPAPRGSSR